MANLRGFAGCRCKLVLLLIKTTVRDSIRYRIGRKHRKMCSQTSVTEVKCRLQTDVRHRRCRTSLLHTPCQRATAADNRRFYGDGVGGGAAGARRRESGGPKASRRMMARTRSSLLPNNAFKGTAVGTGGTGDCSATPTAAVSQAASSSPCRRKSRSVASRGTAGPPACGCRGIGRAGARAGARVGICWEGGGTCEDGGACACCCASARACRTGFAPAAPPLS